MTPWRLYVAVPEFPVERLDDEGNVIEVAHA